jgi:hypothetical protein
MVKCLKCHTVYPVGRWIGNAAEDGHWATVFARLRIPNEGPKGGYKDHGVHAFICPLRTIDGGVCKGVEIRDCGYKVGLNGVDNGAIAFHGVRIPRENLLDRFAQVRQQDTLAGCVAYVAVPTGDSALARAVHFDVTSLLSVGSHSQETVLAMGSRVACALKCVVCVLMNTSMSAYSVVRGWKGAGG